MGDEPEILSFFAEIGLVGWVGGMSMRLFIERDGVNHSLKSG